MRVLWLAALAMLIAAAVLVFAVPGVLSRTGEVCDGAVPVWYPSRNGCSVVPALVEYLWPPERWGAPTYCQGMCLEIEDAKQATIRAEWIAAHPDAVAH